MATAATTTNDTRASFSSTCSELELAAPGSQIRSTTRGGDYGMSSGTSMASPHAAGTAALVLAANPSWSNAQVRQRLQETAQDLGPSGRDSRYGFGLVRADLAAPVSSDTSPPTGAITGRVTSASDGSVISGATVSLDTGQSTIATDGTYGFADVPAGDRSVTASADGVEANMAAVTGSEGQPGSVDLILTPLTPPPSSPTVVVASITYTTEGGSDGKRHVNVTLAVVDGAGSPVGGASVSADVLRNGSQVTPRSGTTGSDGRLTFTLKSASSGCYSTVVTSVSAAGSTWDGNTPTNSFCK
jgi:thermitase